MIEWTHEQVKGYPRSVVMSVKDEKISVSCHYQGRQNQEKHAHCLIALHDADAWIAVEDVLVERGQKGAGGQRSKAIEQHFHHGQWKQPTWRKHDEVESWRGLMQHVEAMMTLKSQVKERKEGAMPSKNPIPTVNRSRILMLKW